MFKFGVWEKFGWKYKVDELKVMFVVLGVGKIN